MNEIDWRALLSQITPLNVAKWILTIGFGVFAFIALTWFASYAWGHS